MTPSMTTAVTSLDDLQALADRVVALVAERGADHDAEVEANVRVSRIRHGLTRFANSFIHQHVGEDTVSVSLTVAVGGRTSSANSTRIAEHELAQLVDTTLASAVLQPVDPLWSGATPPADRPSPAPTTTPPPMRPRTSGRRWWRPSWPPGRS
jgi:predicted Zn-dependent protease